MQSSLQSYLELMLHERPASHVDGSQPGTVFAGTGGRLLLLLKLYDVTGNSTYMTLAEPYVKATERLLPGQEISDRLTGFVGFQWSRVGMWSVLAAYYDRTSTTEGDRLKTKYLKKIMELFDESASQGKYDDFDSGRAGLIYASRFIAENISPRGEPKVLPAAVLSMAQRIVDRGEATGRANGNSFLQWHGPNDSGLWLGQSHGSSGVLQQLLAVPGLLGNETVASLIRATLDHLVSVQFPSGNFPTEYYKATQDWLVQWDHGAPGVSAALLAGWTAMGNESYRASAEKALDCTWRRGLILKGLMNCHGIGGNTWMQLHAAKVTGDLKYVHRALRFQETVLGTPLLSALDQMRQPQPLPDGPWIFWTGSVESAIELWTDLLHRAPANVSMTGWAPKL